MFDVLIIGGGAAGMQCALVLGSAQEKPYAKNKKIGIVVHQKASHLQTALFNNVLGIKPGTLGKDLLVQGKHHLTTSYPHIIQIEEEKVLEVTGTSGDFSVVTSKNTYKAACLVIAMGYTKFFYIKGLLKYVEPHAMSNPVKERIQLKNKNHLVTEGIYVAGTLAGWRSQFSIAAGSGAQVATDILTLWNAGMHTKIHDKHE